MTDKPSFELSIDTRFLYEALIKVEIGATITYSALGAVISGTVHGGSSNLQSALRRAFRLDGMVFENVKHIGYQRLTDQEIVRASTKDTDGIRRKSRRAGERLTKVRDFMSLKPQERIEHNARLSIFSAIAQMTRPTAIRSLEAKVSSSGRELPFAETLEAFRKSA